MHPTSTHTTSLVSPLDSIAEQLTLARQGNCSSAQLAEVLRAQQSSLHSLPQKFIDYYDAVVTRLESSQWFSDESCSFSQSELLDSLDIWLSKARALV